MPGQKTGSPAKTPGRVSLPPLLTTPAKGSPFQGISKTKAPARETKIPNLTEHVAIAKAHSQRLEQGGLLSPAQKAAEASAAAKILKSHATKPETRTPADTSAAGVHRAPPKSHEVSGTSPKTVPVAPSDKLPPWLTKPAVSNPTRKPAPAPSSPRTSPPGAGAPPGYHLAPGSLDNYTPNAPSLAGNTNPRVGMAAAIAKQPKGQITNLPDKASIAAGTALEGAASVPGTLLSPLNIGYGGTGLGSSSTPAVEKVKPTHIAPAVKDVTARLAAASNQAGTALQGAGQSLPKTIPSVDLVPAAGAASTTSYTPQALVAAGLSQAQTTKFRNLALKRGWDSGEINGLVGLDLIKRAYNNPPPLPLRLLQNFGSGVIRTGALANVPVAAAQEISSGHGLRFAKELGNAFAQQGGDVLQHPGQAFVSDPYTFVPIAGGVAKTLGGVAGKALEGMGRQAVERSVTHAVTGEVIPRGVQDRNLYTAAGQSIADKLTSRSPHLSRKLDANRVDKLVQDVSNETAPLHHGVQHAYATAFKAVGAKRAEVLSGINKAGGKPEKVLAKYAADGNARQVKYWTQVVDASKNLNQKDHAFLAAHRELGSGTTATHVALGRFSDTAGIYRAHQPLILSDAHAGDPAAQRVQALHEEWTTALRRGSTVSQEGKPGEAEKVATEYGAAPNVQMTQLFDEYDHAVRQYAASHLAHKGFEPTRVAYTPPPSTGVITSPYTRGTGGKVRFNSRVPKQKVSTGSAFESGNYIIDPKVALRENLQAQRLRTSVGLTSDENLAKVGAIKAERGDERPHGYVFTPSQNPATVGKVITDLHDKPVGAHDYYHQEAQVRDKLAKHLEAGADKTGEHAATKGWFVPEGAWSRILDYTRPESRSKYDQFMRQYQRVMISTAPSTILGNTLGSVPLALAGGAGFKSFAKARESSSLGGDTTLVPHSLHGRGVAGNLAADSRNPLSVGMNKMRRGSVVGEDFSRDATYFSQALKGANKRSKELGYDDTNAYLRDMASGKVDPHVRDAAIAHAIKFAGDAAKPMTKAGRVAGRVILFPQWLQHMTKLMLVTLPLHHPRRMALINALAQYGDTYRQEHGALPNWMQEFAPLFTHTVGGNPFTRVANLSQLSPQGTAGGTFDTLMQPGSITSRIASLANPPVAAALNVALQENANRGSYYPVNMPWYIAHQAAYAIPQVSKIQSASGHGPDSVPFIHETERHYTDGTRKTAWNDNTLPYSQRPGARPVAGLEGFLSRYLGAGEYDVPTPGGKINKATVDKAIKSAQPKTKAWG